MFIIFWEFLMVKQYFLSPQMKGSVIISNKLVKISGKSQNLIELLPSVFFSPPPEMKILSLLIKISWKTKIELSCSALFYMKTRVCLKYFVKDCLW